MGPKLPDGFDKRQYEYDMEEPDEETYPEDNHDNEEPEYLEDR